MKILITGGLGFIGTALLPLLKDHEITIIDNLLSGEQLKFNGTFVFGDIRSPRILAKVKPENFDVVVHLAAIVGEPACQVDPEFSTEVNIIGTSNLMDRLQPQQHIIFLSSSSVYGSVDSHIKVTESTKPKPINLYGKHKHIGEHLVKTSGVPYTILRPATAFGLSRRARLDLLINTLIFEALTTGKIILYEPDIIRPMIHVCDLARFIAQMVESRTLNTIYNVGNPELTLTKRNLVTYIANLTESTVVETNNVSLDPRNYYLDFAAMESTGFTPTYGLHNALNEIRSKLDILSADKDKYTTPAMVKEFISKYGTLL